jgi:hypothetical protein
MTNTDFPSNYPLGFSVYYKNYKLKNTLYIDDGSTAEPLFLEIFNDSTHRISLEAPTDPKATDQNYHFMLRWHRNVLERKDDRKDDTKEDRKDRNFKEDWIKPESNKLDDHHNWDIKTQREGNFITVYYLYLRKDGKNFPLQPKSQNSDNKILLKFLKLSASHEYGAVTTQLELTYGPLMKDRSGELLTTTGSYNSYTNIIELLHRGKQNIPLYAGFTDSHTILNDGVTSNTLTLYVTNTNRSVDLNSDLILSKDSRFIISFETGGMTKKWALVEPDQAKQIQINIAPLNSKDWQVQAPSNLSEPEWIVQPQLNENGQPKKASLKAYEEIQLEITNIVTSHPTGEGNMYIRYENISDYANGTFVVPIEKTPLLYRGNSVGVYTIPRREYTLKDIDKVELNNSTVLNLIQSDVDNQFYLRLNNITILSPGKVKFKYSYNIINEGDNSRLKFSYKTIKENECVLLERRLSDMKIKKSRIQDDGRKIGYHDWQQEEQSYDLESGTYDFTWEFERKVISNVVEAKYFLNYLKIAGIPDGAMEHKNHPPRVYLFDSGTYLTQSQPSKQGLVLYAKNQELASIDDKGNLSIEGDLSIKKRIKDKTGLVMPVGTILYYAGEQSPPPGWLLCDGKQYHQDNYKDLFDVIKHKYLIAEKLVLKDKHRYFLVPLLNVTTGTPDNKCVFIIKY